MSKSWKTNIISGLGQCIAEMHAAWIYNEREGHDISRIHGAVTTGDEWKFTRIVKDVAWIDADVYYITEIEKIVGILVEMLQKT